MSSRILFPLWILQLWIIVERQLKSISGVDLFNKLSDPGLQALPLLYEPGRPGGIVLVHDESRQNHPPCASKRHRQAYFTWIQ